jgi:hypothetical protein
MSSERQLQNERREVIKQDAQLRSQVRPANATTMHEMAQSSVGQELGGRFAHLAKNQTIVAADPRVAMPRMPANSFWAQPFPSQEPLSDQTECGNVLGYSIDAMPGSAEPCHADPPSENQDQDGPSLAGLGSQPSSPRASVEQLHDIAAPDAPTLPTAPSSPVGRVTHSNQPKFRRRI